MNSDDRSARLGAAAKSDVVYPDTPSASAGFALIGRQLELYRAFSEHSQIASERYRGALMTLANADNPERFPQAAHSVRELMKNLHVFINAPVQSDNARLGDKFAALTHTWEKARRSSSCHSDGVWDGAIDRPLRRALEAVDRTIEWHHANRVTWKQTSVALMRGLDVSKRPLPASVENLHYKQWDALLDYFVAVCHYGRDTDEAEFSGNLDTFERFVLDRMKPKTSSEQAVLDELIAEAERGA